MALHFFRNRSMEGLYDDINESGLATSNDLITSSESDAKSFVSSINTHKDGEFC